jgi:type I restriction enzyme S subunit
LCTSGKGNEPLAHKIAGRSLTGRIGFGSTEFHVLRPDKTLLPDWVFAFIRRPSFRSAAEANFTGTAGQKRVPTDFLKSYPIPVPPLAEQERIVNLLDEADGLRKLRSEADGRTGALIPALFHEMFGDHEDFPTATVAELADRREGSIRTGPWVTRT